MKSYQLDELETKREQYIKVIHHSSVHATLTGFFEFLHVLDKEDKEDDKYETHIIYVILQGQDFETWIWKFIVHEYDMDGMSATHVSGYLSDYYGTRDETGWVLFWALGDDVNSDEWYNQHLRQEFGDGEIYEFEDVDNELEEDQSIVVVELRGINGGGYKTVSTKGLKFDYKVK